MAWNFSAKCNRCKHQWDGILCFERVGHYSTQASEYFCQKCCVHLLIAPDLDRFTFSKWVAKNSGAINASAILKHAVSLIQEVVSGSAGLLILPESFSESLICPTCDRSLVSGTLDVQPIVCPNCKSSTGRSIGGLSHVSLCRVVDPLM